MHVILDSFEDGVVNAVTALHPRSRLDNQLLLFPAKNADPYQLEKKERKLK